LLIAGCSTGQQAQRPSPPPAQAALIGMPKAALLACAGTPSRSETKAGIEYLTYLTGSPKAAADAKLPSAVAAASASAGRDRSGYCRVTLGLRLGVIESVTFAGPSAKDLATNSDCMRVIDRCLVR
jgi:hypothetical protein